MKHLPQFTAALTALTLCGATSSCIAQKAPKKPEVVTKSNFVAPPEKEPVTLPGLSVALETGHPLQVVALGQEQVAFVVKNQNDAPRSVTMSVRVESFDGGVVTRDAALQVPAKGVAKWPLPREMFGDKGIKWVQTTLQSNGAKADAVKSSFAYMTPTGAAPRQPGDFVFGIAYGTSPDNANPRSAMATALVGLQAVRSGVDWRRVQTKPGEWNWEWPDKQIAINQAEGLETQWIVSGTTAWAVAPEAKDRPERAQNLPPQPQAWREFVAASARRYTDKARFWEIWNEPDLDFFQGTIEQYLELQRIAYEEIKKADPKQQVMTGGFASLRHAKAKPGMVERTLREGNFDVFAYHQHGDFKGFQREIDGNVLPLMKKTGAGDKPIYFTETAMDTRYGERFQAETMVKKLTFAWARGAIGYTWFNLHDLERAQSPIQPGVTYGLFTNDRDPKAPYPTINTLTALLRDKKFVKQIELPDDQWAFVFANGTEQVVVAWNESTAKSGSQLLLQSDATDIQSGDLMGNRTRLASVEKRVLWPLDNTPHYLILRGAQTQPQLGGALASAGERFLVLPGQPLQVRATLANPLARATNFDVEWKLPTPFGGQTVKRRVPVAAGGAAVVALDVPIPAGYEARFGESTNIGLDYRVADTPWQGTLQIPVSMGALVLPDGNYAATPTFTLDLQEQVTNLTEADPNTEYLLWKNPADLSAQISLARVASGFKVRVAVRDDTFFQAGGKALWDGDSVQLALQGPGQNGPWILTMADVNGTAQVRVNDTPGGLEAVALKPTLTIAREGNNRTYEATFSDAMLGLTGASWKSGVRLNVLVNDNDGRGRKGYIAVAPGFGGNLEPAQFPLLVAAK